MMLFCNLNITKNLVVLKKLWLKKAGNEYEASFLGCFKNVIWDFAKFSLFHPF